MSESPKRRPTSLARRRQLQASVKHPSGLTIRSADMNRAQPTKWLWDQRLLVGYLNLMIGREGIGKGNLIAWVAARLTRGELPGERYRRPCRIAVVGDEDSWDDIWVPRLRAAGADLSYAHAIERGTAGVLNLGSGEDMTALREFVTTDDVGLTYFDQLLDNMGNADSWKEKQVRQALNPVRTLAQETGTSMLMSMHPNKRGGSFRDRISGTPAFNALSRSSLLVAEHPHREDYIAVVRAKGNYSQEPPAFEFRIAQAAVKRPADGMSIPTSRVKDESDNPGLTAEDVLNAASDTRSKGSDRPKVRQLLAEALADRAWHPGEPIRQRILAAGYSDTTLQRARSELGVKTRKSSFAGGWQWRLP